MIGKILKDFVDVIMPKQCINCGCDIDENYLCDNCLSKITFIKNPFCNRCGNPISKDIFDNENTENISHCPSCVNIKLHYDKCHSLFIYDEDSKNIILSFKHSDKSFLAQYFANLFYIFKKDYITENDVILFVPLNYKRLLKRKYNQAGILSLEISKLFKIPVFEDILSRQNFDKGQKSLSKLARKKNITGVFEINNIDKIKDKRILLVDDVMVTGSTVGEISKLLKKNGCSCVNVLTIARTTL